MDDARRHAFDGSGVKTSMNAAQGLYLPPHRVEGAKSSTGWREQRVAQGRGSKEQHRVEGAKSSTGWREQRAAPARGGCGRPRPGRLGSHRHGKHAHPCPRAAPLRRCLQRTPLAPTCLPAVARVASGEWRAARVARASRALQVCRATLWSHASHRFVIQPTRASLAPVNVRSLHMCVHVSCTCAYTSLAHVRTRLSCLHRCTCTWCT